MLSYQYIFSFEREIIMKVFGVLMYIIKAII